MIDFANFTEEQLEIRERFLPRLSWKPEPPDQRDHVYDHMKVVRKYKRTLPYRADLRKLNLHKPIFNQLNIGSCVSNANGKIFQFIQRLNGLGEFMPSRLFNYYEGRKLENSIYYDSGLYIRDGMKVLADQGAPREELWAYDTNKFTQQPPQVAYEDALLHQALEYQAVEVKTTAVKAAIADQHPVQIGFSVYESFWRISSNGFMPVPKLSERLEGGHSVAVWGYDRLKAPWDKNAIDYGICLNSWDEDWGDVGFFYMPLRWMCDRANADDFWIIKRTEG